jgi:cell division septation protein DedD
MSLPTSEHLPSEDENLTPARKRRRRRTILQAGPGSRAELLDALARSVIPSIDFFLFSLLSGAVLGAAILFDARALFVLAALAAPFMAPAIGLSLATAIGSWSFFLQSLASFSVGSLLVFIAGILTGWIANSFPGLTFEHTAEYAAFTWPDFVILTLGAVVTVVMLVKKPDQKPRVASVALAYELYIPIGLAGFGMTSGITDFWLDGLTVFAVHLGWVALVGTATLLVMGLRPFNIFGYALGTSLAMAGIAALIVISGLGIATRPYEQAAVVLPTETSTLTNTPQPSATVTPSPVPPTITPSNTATSTPTRTTTPTPNPEPTPIWASVKPNEFGGAFVRAEPDYAATVVKSLLNDFVIEILPEAEQEGNAIWVKVRTQDGTTGWMVRSLLITATPSAQ